MNYFFERWSIFFVPANEKLDLDLFYLCGYNLYEMEMRCYEIPFTAKNISNDCILFEDGVKLHLKGNSMFSEETVKLWEVFCQEHKIEKWMLVWDFFVPTIPG